MRVLMPIYNFLPIMGGAERQALRVASALQRRGHEVTIVTGRWKSSWPREERVDGVRVVRNGALWDRLDAIGGFPLRHFTYLFTLALYLVRHRKKYDLLHVHQALHAAFVSVLVARLLGKKVLVKVGCGGAYSEIKAMRERRVNPLSHRMWRVIRRCDRFVAISEEIEKELTEDGIPACRVATIPNGLLLEKSAGKREYTCATPARLICVGRLVPQKAFDVVIASLAKLKHLPIRCDIYGEGPEQGTLQEMIDRLDLGDVVKLRGVRDDILELYPACDIFILCSRAEGLSNALLEAMGHGLPCVVSNIGGNRDLVSPDEEGVSLHPGSAQVAANGVLVEPDDAEGLAAAIAQLLEDKELRARLGQRAAALVAERYAMDGVVESYLSLYRELCTPARLS